MSERITCTAFQRDCAEPLCHQCEPAKQAVEQKGLEILDISGTVLPSVNITSESTNSSVQAESASGYALAKISYGTLYLRPFLI